MPGSNPQPVDLRSYRPAAVLVLDLVKHSARDQATTMAVQSAISEALSKTLSTLHLVDTHFNHTGDGYVCSFLGDDSARSIDFISALYPVLLSYLGQFDQEFRGGMAYGLLHLRKDPLTHRDTHFDLPGIEAARLEQAARPGQILCTPTVYAIFHRHYPNLFTPEAITVQTKDRVLSAYELQPSEVWDIQIRQRLLDFIFRRSTQDATKRSGILLLVDDHDDSRGGLKRLFEREYPDRIVLEGATGEEGLTITEEQECALIVTDIVMPVLDGVEMVRRVRERVQDQIVIGLSAYASEGIQKSFFQAGGFIFLVKPCMPPELMRVTSYALSQPPGETLRQTLSMMCDDVASLWYALHEIAEKIGLITRFVGTGNGLAQELLRHKAKHLINEGLARLGPGREPVEEMQHLNVRLSCVERLARIVGRLGVQKVSAFIRTLITDLHRVHPDVAIRFEDQIDPETESEIHFGGVVVLAIAELLDNAVAAVGDRGTVTVTIATLHAAGMLQVSVKDDGPGVPADVEARMFNENYSTKGAGRGLGLHLVRESTRLLRGSISYDRRDGAEFCVRLPLSF